MEYFRYVSSYNLTPNVILKNGNEGVSNSPTLISSGFKTVNGNDNHISTDWVIENTNGEVIWSQIDSSSFLSVDVPAGKLFANTEYVAKVRHTGEFLGGSEWGVVTFKTKSSFFPAPVVYNVGEENGTFVGVFDAAYEYSPESVEWEISLYPNFATLEHSYSGTENLDSWSPDMEISDHKGGIFYIRVRHQESGNVTDWSESSIFTLPNYTVETPDISIEGQPSNILKSPLVNSAPFAYQSGITISHTSTDWMIEKDGVAVYKDFVSEDLTETRIPEGVLERDTIYTFKVRYNLGIFGSTDWGIAQASTAEYFALNPVDSLSIDETLNLRPFSFKKRLRMF